MALCAAVRPPYFPHASRLACDFRGQKKEAPPLPMNQDPNSRLQSVLSLPCKPLRCRLHGNLRSSPYGRFTAELFAARDLLSSPVVSATGSLPHGSTDSLRPRTLNAPFERKRTPWVDLAPRDTRDTSPTSCNATFQETVAGLSPQSETASKGLSGSPMFLFKSDQPIG